VVEMVKVSPSVTTLEVVKSDDESSKKPKKMGANVK